MKLNHVLHRGGIRRNFKLKLHCICTINCRCDKVVSSLILVSFLLEKLRAVTPAGALEHTLMSVHN